MIENAGQLSRAAEYLDFMIESMNNSMKMGGFDNDSVMWLIKIWTKIGLNSRGDNYHNNMKGTWVMKRQPKIKAAKKSVILRNALSTLLSVVEKTNYGRFQYFISAQEAMIDFVWEYRHRLSGNQEADFVHQAQKWLNMSTDDVLRTVLVPSEAHA